MIKENGTASRRIAVQVIIVSYKTADFVKKSLAQIDKEREKQAALGIDIDCYVIDNSGDDYEPLQAEVHAQGWAPWATIVLAEKNGGFAYGNNRGFEHGFSRARPPDYFYLLNPDAEIRLDAIKVLVDFMEAHPRAGAAASGIEDDDGTLWAHAFRFPNPADEFIKGARLGIVTKLLSRFAVGREMSTQAEEVDWFAGAAMICRAETVRELGGMDEAFFLYYEETDFCLKLIRNGWSNWFVPDSRVKHAAGQSTGVTTEGNETRPFPKYWFESRRRYFLKNHGPVYASVADATALLGHALGSVQISLRGKGDTLRPGLLKGLAEESGLFGRRGFEIPSPQERLKTRDGSIP